MKIYCGYGVPIEVTDEWNEILLAADRNIAANDKKETRRHCSMEAYNLDDGLIPAKGDFVKDIETRDSAQYAISQLKPENQKLARLFYLEEREVADIAEILGVKTPAVYRRLGRVAKKLQEILSKM